MDKQRYEYYNGSTTIIDNELDTYVEDVVDRLNTQDFNKNELLKVKQRLESRVADLEAKLAESESKVRVSNSSLASLQLEYNQLKKEYDEQEKLLSQVLATNSRLQFENDQLKQQLAETDKLMQEYLSKCLSLEQQLEDEKYKTGELCSLIDEIRYEDPKIKELQQKLEEKENLLGLIEDGYYTPTKIVKRQLKEEYQTAITELIKVQKYITDNAIGVEQECFGREINNKLDQQINDLRSK